MSEILELIVGVFRLYYFVSQTNSTTGMHENQYKIMQRGDFC